MKRETRMLVALALLGRLERQEGALDACPVCGSHARASTGECDACGVYRCACGELHYGDASKPCPEQLTKPVESA